MSTDSTYTHKVSERLTIENGIMKSIEVPIIIKHNSYGELVLESLRAQPNFVGQVDAVTGMGTTFDEMTEKSVKCAMWLKEVNVMPGDVVGICSHNHMDLYVPCYASLYVGALCSAWWDLGITKEMAKCFLQTTSPKVIFASEETVGAVFEAIEEIAADVRIVVFGEKSNFLSLCDVLATQAAKNVADFSCTKLSSLEDPSAIVFTSGSTGVPKGVVYSNKSLFYNVKRFASFNGDEKIAMLDAPLAWLSGLYGLLWGAVGPTTRIIFRHFTEESCLRYIEKYKVTWLDLGSTAAIRLQKYADKTKYDVSSLKGILIGGSIITEETQRTLSKSFPNAFIYQVYGSTELGGLVVVQEKNYRPGSCGRLIGNQIMKVVDTETGRTKNPNETGEACFKTPYMMKGYYKNPEATRETIDSEGWLHTGDLVYYDEEGFVFIVDRLKEVMKYQGFQVTPTIIEKFWHEHPDIQEIAVVARPHKIDDSHPIAFVVKKPGAQITEQIICKMVSETFPDYMKLRGGVVFMDKLPHTGSGKIAKSVLRELAKSYNS